MHHSAELIFCTERSQNTNVSDFVTAGKAIVGTYTKKRTIGDLAYPMQCCGSGSGIRCFFTPRIRIRDPGWSNGRIRIRDPG
jgi:hypothetical protein